LLGTDEAVVPKQPPHRQPGSMPPEISRSAPRRRAELRLAAANAKNFRLRAEIVRRGIRRALIPSDKARLARLVVTLISVAFFHAFPFLVMTSYMSWEGFFSYDMFKDGTSAITAFYWWTEAVVIVAAVYLCGSAGFFVHLRLRERLAWSRMDGVERVTAVGLIVTNLSLVAVLAMLDLTNPTLRGFTKLDMLWTGVVAFWVTVHIAVLVSGKAQVAFGSLVFAGIPLLISLSIFAPGALAFPYNLTLQFFGTGGGLPMSYRTVHMPKPAEGRLVLAAPENIYFYPTGQAGLSIVRRSDLLEFKVQNLSGFGHYPVRRSQGAQEPMRQGAH
jgi:hypothetical protein